MGKGCATITAAEAAELLGVNVRTVYRACSAGQLPSVQVGRAWRISAPGLEALLGVPIDTEPAEAGAGG